MMTIHPNKIEAATSLPTTTALVAVHPFRIARSVTQAPIATIPKAKSPRSNPWNR